MAKVLYEIDEDPRVAWIKLNESKMNFLSFQVLQELYEAIFRAEKGESYAMIISSTSENFSAGADLKELRDLSFEEGIKWFERYMEVVRLLRASSKPTIAAVRGACVGGGNEIAMACDLVVASRKAKFGQPEVRVGSTAMGLGVQLLPLLVGEKRARELLLTGRIITAEEALQIGLINRVVDDEKLEMTAKELALEIVENCSPQAFRVIKSGLNFWTDLAMISAQIARDLTCFVWNSAEFKERSEEFLQKKKLKSRIFKGLK
ncbi:MAG: enoyl-CoA hydratase/isomerase family protein [Archaeoglobaceae archaeon]|nr:enoyl-CoA hydratase/isomerase family protein [Archaeoglobaceae archaeon]MDW8128509.1 enoyl-CoA hydratase/isomerase family protein [Archaeoglobaceae archaeon]